MQYCKSYLSTNKITILKSSIYANIKKYVKVNSNLITLTYISLLNNTQNIFALLK